MSDDKSKDKEEEEPHCSPPPSAQSCGSSSSESDASFSVESVRKYLAEKLGFYFETDDKASQTENKIISNLTFKGLTEHWKENGFNNIITMVGAGISTSAGIPDFRSPGSGLYDNLEKYNLPHPTAIFEMDYFRENPKPFFVLAKELYPGSFRPTPCHYFVRLLHEKGLLVRHYTQNIDTLERIAGIPDEKLVEAHGTFYTNHCLECNKMFSMEWMKDEIFENRIPICDSCPGVVKPDIVFFGENLPEKFYDYPDKDFQNCDLLIIMGTSLEVQPFASLIGRANSRCIRLLINREKVGTKRDGLASWLTFGKGLTYDCADNKRDIAWIGDCDDGVYALADAIGFGDELREMIKREHEKIQVYVHETETSVGTEFEPAEERLPPEEEDEESSVQTVEESDGGRDGGKSYYRRQSSDLSLNKKT